MPRNLRRYHESGQAHFITFSCYRRQKMFTCAAACELFVATLEKMRLRFALSVYGFVVMPEHVHLLVSEPGLSTLASAMHFLKLSFSKAVRPLLVCEGPFWQKRYYDLNVRNYRQFTEKLRYIHRNPVRRELCARPDEWPWSSFRHYAERKRLEVEIESEWTAEDRENRGPGREYSRRFLVPR